MAYISASLNQDFLTTDFHASKSNIFLVPTHPTNDKNCHFQGPTKGLKPGPFWLNILFKKI
jgi:hypothetical protein